MQKIAKFAVAAFAFTSARLSFATGVVTHNVLSLASNITSLANGVCLVIGIGLIGGALLQYKQHRRNKLMVPISRPIVMLILGIILVCVPLLSTVAPGGKIIHQEG